MSDAWEVLSSGELVFKVQSYFGVEKVEKEDKKEFRVRSKFFHYLFLFGTELGDELFYGIFIPVFFFNIDSYIGRRFVFHWFVNMYVGQALKEVFEVERPKPPAIQMQKKWSNEYSLPSTHAMGSLSIAATIVYFAIDRYNLNLWFGIAFTVVWVSVISLSRVYLGMHTVADLVLGVAISIVLLAVLLPLTDAIEYFFAMSKIGPIGFLVVPIILIVYFPTTKLWTPTRGDTCVIAAVCSGVELGTWFNYHYGITQQVNAPLPLSLDFSDYYSLAARTVVGLAVAGISEFVGKLVFYAFFCKVVNEDRKKLKEAENSASNVNKNFVDLASKFVTYTVMGFNIIVLVPQIYKYFNIQRDAFFNEM